jgi:hypothetical protein
MAIPHPWKAYSDKDFVQKFWLENKITETIYTPFKMSTFELLRSCPETLEFYFKGK